MEITRPTIPIIPTQNTPDQNNQNTQNNQSQNQNNPKPKALLYAIEILIFAFVGWGWLGIREFLGNTPVLDISIMLCVLISSFANLVLAIFNLEAYTKAFFAHILSLVVLYIYSLCESTIKGSVPLCCNGASIYAVAPTYAAAYFGSLPLHQAAGAVTLAFLLVLLILAAGQLRVCFEDPREWLTYKIVLSITCLVSFHLGLFVNHTNVCGGMGSAIIGLGFVNWLLMFDYPLCFGKFNKMVQLAAEWTFTVLLAGVGGVQSSQIGGLFILLIFGASLLWQSIKVGLEIWKLVSVKTEPTLDYRFPNDIRLGVRKRKVKFGDFECQT
jgi:hypothetical protein